MNKTKFFFSLLLLISFFSTSLSSQDWTYSGKTGPEHWSELSPAFAAGKGEGQSPININLKKVELENTNDLAFSYTNSPFSLYIKNKGGVKDIELIPDSLNKHFIKLGSDKYYLQQIHFHLPSEHRFNNKKLDLEAHFVHKNEKGELAVVGILYKKGQEDKAISQIWEALEGKEDTLGSIIIPENFPLPSLLPRSLETFQYEGSLTTPPTVEGVKWILFKEIKTISPEQLSHFKKWLKKNNRPVQPLNGRVVKEFK